MLNLSRKEGEIMQQLMSSSKELYGLEMVSASNGNLKRGTVYVTLMRMEDKGLVESRKDTSELETNTIPRRLYKVTGLGVRVFNAWQTANLEFVASFAT